MAPRDYVVPLNQLERWYEVVNRPLNSGGQIYHRGERISNASILAGPNRERQLVEQGWLRPLVDQEVADLRAAMAQQRAEVAELRAMVEQRQPAAPKAASKAGRTRLEDTDDWATIEQLVDLYRNHRRSGDVLVQDAMDYINDLDLRKRIRVAKVAGPTMRDWCRRVDAVRRKKE